MNINEIIATELQVHIRQVMAAIELLENGATVPFIARYRKEATGGLDDSQLRALEERWQYLCELEDRRQTILKSIKEQDKLTPELEQSILAVDNKSQLEDLYLPYKPKRRTKSQIAKEAGLEPLAFYLLQNPETQPEKYAENFLNPEKNILQVTEALEGARQILIEHFSEDADLLSQLRDFIWDHALLKSEVIKGKEIEGQKFADYFQYEEAIKKIPSHRMLALLRGQREEILQIQLYLQETMETIAKEKIYQHFHLSNKNYAASGWLIETADMTWRVRLFLKFEIEMIMRLRESAEIEAIHVFANNLKNLLLTAPAGSRVTLGLDPGLRTGVKYVVVDGTGKLLTHGVIFPHEPKKEWMQSLHTLYQICKTFAVELISIGNGTASRETDKLIVELKKAYPDLKLTSIVVSEAGASVYSASEFAALEFPDLDVSYRGAVSIARRLQDPLAELVKIDPKAIGVGQYQHDVNQTKLAKSLHAVMEDCVNAVGVDVNTASIPLLSCIAGLNESVAKNIVAFRDEHGAFKNRQQLKKVSRLGEKAFEQSAGFLRIVNGDDPLDASAVHPEAYVVVEKILKKQQVSIRELMGNTSVIKKLAANDYVDAQFGVPTVTDIFKELDKPGRDPRPQFKTAEFKEGIETIADLKVGMVLEGVITNVANFGAFVDIGVHQDGLVHVSALANHFVKDPNSVVKVGDIVKVKVLEVDTARKRIQLSMRLNDAAISSPKFDKKIDAKNEMKATLGSVLLKAYQKK